MVRLSSATEENSGIYKSGVHAAAREILRLCTPVYASKEREFNRINVFPGPVSLDDVNWLKKTLLEHALIPVFLPRQVNEAHQNGLAEIESMYAAAASLELALGEQEQQDSSPGRYLLDSSGIPLYSLELPIGLKLSDSFYLLLKKLSGSNMSADSAFERQASFDLFEKTRKEFAGISTLVYGESSLSFGLTALLLDIGLQVKVLATDAGSVRLDKRRFKAVSGSARVELLADTDFVGIEEYVRRFEIKLILGCGKSNRLSQALELLRARLGNPFHERVSGFNNRYFGYQAARELHQRLWAVLQKAGI